MKRKITSNGSLTRIGMGIGTAVARPAKTTARPTKMRTVNMFRKSNVGDVRYCQSDDEDGSTVQRVAQRPDCGYKWNLCRRTMSTTMSTTERTTTERLTRKDKGREHTQLAVVMVAISM